MSEESLLGLAKACPWCESPEVWVWDKAVPGRLAVACSNPDCAAVGPLASTEARAIALWNCALRRVPTAGKPSARLRRILDEAEPTGRIDDELAG